MFEKFSVKDAENLKSHFANLCQLAMADAMLNKQETNYLMELCNRYGIEKEEFDYVLENAYSIGFVSPDLPLVRLEQMYDLVRMVLVDEIIDERKVELCVKVARKLGFRAHIVGDLIKALVTVNEDTGEENLGLEELKMILKATK